MRGLTAIRVLVAVGWMMASAAPARAHCGDDCADPLPLQLWPASAELAADGVLSFYAGFGRADAALEFFTLRVLDGQGEEVAGSFELYEEFSTFVWRPAQPWTAGATYTVMTYVDTAAWASAVYGAAPGACVTYERENAVTIAAEPLPPPAAPPLAVTSTHVIETKDRLADLVCCDGAYPRLEQVQGHCPASDPERVEYADGSCTHLRTHGQLDVAYEVEHSMLPALAAGNFAHRLLGPDDQAYTGKLAGLRAPGCLRFESLDLARGEVFVDERCHGDGLADQLGPLELDPSDMLAGQCEGPAYVCEGQMSWDPDSCKTWPDGEDYMGVAPEDSPPGEPAEEPGAPEAAGAGTGCSAHERPGLLALVVLVGLARRRRA
ncbi:hypothetical protein [Nannocystis pusilla]|uniref:Uncharacterized protein n=1 Tax=Nannocystis pusilla TaxID=889268 RepID=A0ABS7TMW9_9BACT|nr:hypothetical protein [Nannocystis pusilla]MBZ5709582.1 hypothetical protein [Nannocystis pusilla]